MTVWIVVSILLVVLSPLAWLRPSRAQSGRIALRTEARRILMMISDGAPVDDSTLSTNSANYLERHLRQVINWIENSSPVDLVAIGIGHDVTRYYRRAVTIVDAEDLGGTMMQQLADLFDEQASAASGRRTSRKGRNIKL